MKNRTVIIVALSLLTYSVLSAQITVYSPYSRFGIGELNLSGFDMNKALGGAAIGLRSENNINYLNPASYSAQDTLSFLFEFGVNGSIRKLSTETENTSVKEGNIGHFAIGFPIMKNWGASIGLIPYSRTGYDVVFKGILFNGENRDGYQINYNGNGGINQFYIGTGIKVFDFLSVGVNFSYLFGTLERDRIVTLIDTLSGDIRLGTAQSRFQDKMDLRNMMFSFGLQGFKNFGEEHRITAGFTIDNKTDLKGDYNSVTYGVIHYSGMPFENSDTVNINGKAEIPLKIGAGFTYSFKERLIVAFDYTTQDWSKTKIFDDNENITNSNCYRFGIQYTPVSLKEMRRAKYWQRISFRIGGYYNNSYIKINNDQIDDKGLSFGLGIPWKNENKLLTKSSFNLTYQLGQKGSTDNGLIKETYHTISIGITLYDFWFIKSKYD